MNSTQWALTVLGLQQNWPPRTILKSKGYMLTFQILNQGPGHVYEAQNLKCLGPASIHPLLLLPQAAIPRALVRLVRISVFKEVSEAQMCDRGYRRHALGAGKAKAVSIFCEPTPPAS